MAKSAAQTSLYDHSEAKVKLYGRYLSIYLNVLSRVPFIEKIYLFDLFCGEGIYEDGGKGSPIVALECIKDHYFANNKSCPNIAITFNDSEKSEIEPEKWKVERVEEFAKKIFQPPSVQVGYTKIDYTVLVQKVIERTDKLGKNERALLFIDPWGYKEIDPEDLKKLMANGKTEIILFLPIYFMSRFANKSVIDTRFAGGEALRQFLGKLFGGLDKVPYIENQQQFIYRVQEQLKTYLGLTYVDCFKIERENNNWFSLFFFTSNKKGFWKMLDAKWSIDKKSGAVFKGGEDEKQQLFDEFQITSYHDKVLQYLLSDSTLTNHDLVDFGLANNFLPKHTKAVLDDLKKKHPFNIISLDDKPASSYYLGDEKRFVNIQIKQ